MIPGYAPAGTVICPCGHVEHGVVNIDNHAKVGMTVRFKQCFKCSHFKPHTNSTKHNPDGCCSPIKVIEDKQSLKTKEWWKKVQANGGRIP